MATGMPWVCDAEDDTTSLGHISLLRNAARVLLLWGWAYIEFWSLFAAFCTQRVCGWMKTPFIFGYYPAALLGILGVPVIALALGMKPYDIIITIVLPGLFALLLNVGRADA